MMLMRRMELLKERYLDETGDWDSSLSGFLPATGLFALIESPAQTIAYPSDPLEKERQLPTNSQAWQTPKRGMKKTSVELHRSINTKKTKSYSDVTNYRTGYKY